MHLYTHVPCTNACCNHAPMHSCIFQSMVYARSCCHRRASTYVDFGHFRHRPPTREWMVSTCWEGLRPSRPPAQGSGGATASQTPGGGRLLLPPRIEVEQDDSNTQHFYNQANRFLETFARHRCMSQHLPCRRHLCSVAPCRLPRGLGLSSDHNGAES